MSKPSEIKIALSAGHRNASRKVSPGNPCELRDDRTGHMTAAVAAELRRRGFDVRVVQPDDGLGFHPGPLDDVGAQVVRWSRDGWHANLFLEFHFEGNKKGDEARGCFLIYPNQRGELDTDAKNRLAPLIVAGVARHANIPRRGDGTMAESETLAGNLGVFRGLSPLRATLTRGLIEVANCESPLDAREIRKPDFLERAALGVAAGVSQFFDVAAATPLIQPQRMRPAMQPGIEQPAALPPGVRLFVVGPRGAIVRQDKTADALEVRRLPAGMSVPIKAIVFDRVLPDRNWLHLQSDEGFAEASAFQTL